MPGTSLYSDAEPRPIGCAARGGHHCVHERRRRVLHAGRAGPLAQELPGISAAGEWLHWHRNLFGTDRQSFLEELNVPFIIAGYLGEAAPSHWTLWNNSAATVHATILGRDKERDIYPVLTKVLQESRKRAQPFFVLCRSKEAPTVVQARMARLRTEPFLQRKIYWLKPSDLAATARIWLKENTGKNFVPKAKP
jgi:hypothetical protein